MLVVRAISGALFAIAMLSSTLTAQDVSRLTIPYEKFTLSNGFTVIVHEDHKAPIVAVNIWYHVGSKNEIRGRTGFAHLFEHLMFNGTEHFNQDYFKVLEKLGATSLNGTTNEDRTNYFQNVPTSALDTVLWMESDRMGHLLGVIDQARLDEQRGVVQNEKRQGENQPYGLVWNMLTEYSYPANHPYSWPVIGSMEDLNAATLNDVREWFKKYYGPSNATLVLAGDIDLKTAKDKVEKFFGAIPPGPPLPKPAEWIAKNSETRRLVLEDRVAQARIYKAWNTPPYASPETDQLRLAAHILGGGKTSRLYRRLVYRDQIATDVTVFADGSEISGGFLIFATASPGKDIALVSKVIDEELARFIAEGPGAEELKSAKTQSVASFVRGMERIGGFGGKSDILAQSQVFTGSPDHYRLSLATVEKSTTASLRDVAKKWLSDGVLELEVRPFPNLKPGKGDVDRSKVPEPGPISDARFPKLERVALSNGMKVIFAERHDTPIVNFALAVDSGYAADQLAIPGTAKLAMTMLDQGTKTRNALQIGDQLEALGAQLGAGANLDTSFVTLSALKANVDPSLEIFSDVIRNPSFPASDFQREQNRLLAGIAREKTTPMMMAQRLLPAFIYGKKHAYSNPLTGSGTEASVRSISREAVAKFHQTWFHPNNATLIVVGDTSLAEIKPKLEKAFGAWPKAEVPKLEVAKVEHLDKSVVYLMDRPGSMQSTIMAAHVAPPRSSPDEISFRTLNTVLGGAFVSRINMNIREDKHWSYGAGSLLAPARGQRPFIVYAPVQTDKTKESAAEIRKELQEILRGRPVTAEELGMARDNQILSLPGSRETSFAVMNNILEMVQHNLPEDYFDTFSSKVRALTITDMSTAAEKLIRPDKLVWVIVGDRAKIEAGIRDLNLGELHLIDADGNPIT